MTFSVPPPSGRPRTPRSPAREPLAGPRSWWRTRRLRTQVAIGSALGLAVATVGITAATAGEVRRIPHQGPVPAATRLADEVTARLVASPTTIPSAGDRRTGDLGPLTRSPGTLPSDAAAAYLLAALTIHDVAPDCHVSAYLLAAVGRVASDHGRLPAARQRRGAADTDRGQIDHDPRADHPVGPMRLLPATWTAAGVDADGDGIRNPRDLDDAALGTAVYLCAAFRADGADARVDQALAAWSTAPGFAARVRSLARAYAANDYAAAWAVTGPAPALLGTSAFTAATPLDAVGPTGVGSSATRSRGTRGDRAVDGLDRPGGTRPATHAPTRPGPAAAPGSGPPAPPPTGAPDPGTSAPTPGGSTGPTPSDEAPGSPQPPEPSPTHTLSGTLERQGDDWSVAGVPVDVGDATVLQRYTRSDLDGDDALEANLDELDGLVGREVTLQVDAGGRLTTVDGQAYDG